ncbi:MAG: histidine phosphatase family protein [Polaromonas sp.]|nr:histidine phosphatase family protein [Polaromonas sp.]
MQTFAPLMRRALATTCMALMCAFAGGSAHSQTPGAEIMLRELKKGGLVLFMRHGETGPAYADRAQAVIGDCSTQRNLNAQGRQQNEKMAQAMKVLRLPVGKVLASDFCRSWQTAEALFGKTGYTVTTKLTVPMSYPSVSPADAELNNQNLNALLSEKPAAGSNTFLVSHGINVLLATGYHPNVQGEVVVFRPDGNGKYSRMGSLLPEDWSRMAPGAGTTLPAK